MTDGREQSGAQPVHLGSMAQIVPRAVRAYGPDRLGPGDMLVTNDPYGGGVHLNDVTVIAPVFAEDITPSRAPPETEVGVGPSGAGEADAPLLFGYVANLAHHVDVGGGAPASIGDVQIVGNRMDAATGGLIFSFVPGGAYRGPFVIADNHLIASDRVSDEGSKGAFFFAHAENVTIRNNNVSFPGDGGMTAVELRDSQHVDVSGNTFTNAGPTMLATEGSSDYHVS